MQLEPPQLEGGTVPQLVLKRGVLGWDLSPRNSNRCKPTYCQATHRQIQTVMRYASTIEFSEPMPA